MFLVTLAIKMDESEESIESIENSILSENGSNEENLNTSEYDLYFLSFLISFYLLKIFIRELTFTENKIILMIIISCIFRVEKTSSQAEITQNLQSKAES